MSKTRAWAIGLGVASDGTPYTITRVIVMHHGSESRYFEITWDDGTWATEESYTQAWRTAYGTSVEE